DHIALGFSYSLLCRVCAFRWSDPPIFYGEGQLRQSGHGFSDSADPGRTSGFLALGHHRFRFSSNGRDPDLAGSSASPGGRYLSEDAARPGYPRDDYDHGLLRDPAVRFFLRIGHGGGGPQAPLFSGGGRRRRRRVLAT